MQAAKVAESVDALVLGASGVTRESSSLSFRTNPGTRARHDYPGTSSALRQSEWLVTIKFEVKSCKFPLRTQADLNVA
jgi:hypothetical protein